MAKELKEYNRKRNFEKTGEPEGRPENTEMNPEEAEGNPEVTEGRLRFAVQHHIAGRDHFDFRLEWNGALLSWAVPKGPSYDTRDKRLAVQVEDHPLEYRNFEGIIPKGEYGGGVVMLWDEGYWEPQADVEEGLGNGSLKIVLKGRRLKGKWALIRLKAKTREDGRSKEKAGKAENNWLLLKEKDDYAKADDGISEFTTSVRTGRTMTEIEHGEDKKINITRNPFQKIEVQLAKLVNTVPEGEDWLYELKYDGYRILAYIEGDRIQLITRNGKDYTKQFQEIAYTLVDWAAGRAMVLDGEMVIADAGGRTDFQALQSYMRNPGGKNLTYIVFDLLALEGTDLRRNRLVDRKASLETLMKDSPKNLYFSKHVRGNGKAGFLAACEGNLEGIVGKKADSVYSGTRNGDWIKLKCDTRQEFVIGGYTLSDKKTSGVSSLLLGFYEGKELVYAGRAGTGFTARNMRELEEKFQRLKRETTPFKHSPGSRKDENITWLEPVLVAEIKFAQWTEENLLRQASFKGLRTDKDPGDIKREAAEDNANDGKRTEEAKAEEVKAEEAKSGRIKADEAGVGDDIRTYEAETSRKKFDKTKIDIIKADVKKADKVNEKKADKLKVNKTKADEMKLGKTKTGKKRADEKANEEQSPKEEQSPGKGGERSIRGNGSSITIEGVRISSPDKVIFEAPEIKKADVVRYYAKVSERMLPYAGNRILSIVRCPKGISESCFFKKHPGPDSNGVVAMPVMNSSGEEEDYFYIENSTGLLSEAQMGTLEFHTWGSRANDLEKPDMMVFDLDPDEGMDIGQVRQGVKDTKSLLDQLSLISYLKTSGGKGYHVVVPFKPTVGWEPFHDFARHIAEAMEQKWPGRYTSNVRKDKRKNRIFIDWIRNGRGATSIAPYSIRARKGAPVSMPITWEELDAVAPDGVNMADALVRIVRDDPWKDFHQVSQHLK